MKQHRFFIALALTALITATGFPQDKQAEV